MVRRCWIKCATLASVLAATACAPEASTPDAGSTGPLSSVTKTATDIPTEPATDPSTEGTGAESPQSPNNAPSVVVASPLDSLNELKFFTVGNPTNCFAHNLVRTIGEDVAVAEVILSPEGVFIRDDAACSADNRPLCFDFVFPAGQQSRCYVGVRWRPETGVTSGKLTLKLTAICVSRDDRLCADLADPPPPGGTSVVALSSTDLRKSPFNPDTGSPSVGPPPPVDPSASLTPKATD
jgi:hypothetical protein